MTLRKSGRVIGGSRGVAGRVILARGIWTCPRCQRLNEGGFTGSVALAIPRYEPDAGTST